MPAAAAITIAPDSFCYFVPYPPDTTLPHPTPHPTPQPRDQSSLNDFLFFSLFVYFAGQTSTFFVFCVFICIFPRCGFWLAQH